MRVAVVTPYYTEPLEVLRACHDSVAEQSHACAHVMVADGHPRPEIAAWPVEHIVLPAAHADNGNTPRCLGSLSAANRGAEAIAYLDADNWYRTEHIAEMVALHRRTGAAVCTSGRSIHRLDGSFMFHDRHDSDGRKLVDTSCLFLTRAAFGLIPLWAQMWRPLAPICDQVFWWAVRQQGLSHAHLDRSTVCFRSQYDIHYRRCGEAPPPTAKRLAELVAAYEAWRAGLGPAETATWSGFLTTGRWTA